MKFGGSFNKNWSSANGSGNTDFQKDVILDEVSRLIELDRPVVISALKDAGYSISPKAKKKEVIDKTVSALYRSNQFRHDIAKAIVSANDPKYANAGGSASGAGAGAGKVGGGIDPVTAIANASAQLFGIFSSGFASRQEKLRLQQEQERTKQEMYDKLLTENEKTNYLPYIIIGGVLIIGGIVAFFALRNKK